MALFGKWQWVIRKFEGSWSYNVMIRSDIISISIGDQQYFEQKEPLKKTLNGEYWKQAVTDWVRIGCKLGAKFAS